ncbi:3-hydroxyacyl-ACP dehydratase FabZ family protein [Thiocapsa roseopersicina]|uniref:FabA-like domain-containing protein n=1 Tax=Thiocapsa roseopersicina TaxID=1058 RepID=A0A1H2YMR5_THIRO|nr:3-hydroxyacyl-ACP dehydratase FabZ family protein [Thiocapsa roseopersicina]SDX06275.1 FabA-like domain-containing protein [Thiocapsa roseopersicina]
MQTSRMPTRRISIPLEHPVFEGHFPGRPIMPGSLLIDLVLAAWENSGGDPVTSVPSVKFHRPVAPGDTLVLHFTPTITGTGAGVRFTCLREETLVCSGLLAPQAP